MSKQDLFLKKLQGEAKLQSKLSTSHVFPQQLDFFTALVGNYPWQTLFILSGITALILTVVLHI